METASDTRLAGAINRLMKKSEDIQLREESRVIDLSIWERDPGLASAIANFMAGRLIDKSAELTRVNAEKAYDFTRTHMEKARIDLEEANAKLMRFKEANGVFDFAKQKNGLLGRLDALEREYDKLLATIRLTEVKVQESDDIIPPQRDELLRAPMFVSNPAIQDLVRSLNAQEVKLAEALEIFTQESEEVRILEAKIAEVRQKLQAETKAIVDSNVAVLQNIHPNLVNEYVRLRTDLTALSAKKKMMEDKMEGLRTDIAKLSAKQTTLEELSRDRDTAEKLYINLSEDYAKLGVQKAFEMSAYDIKIIDKASLPPGVSPDRPQWTLIIAVGFIGSILLSLGIVFTLEYWDESLRTPQEVEEKLDLDVLCTVPNISRFA
jgi:uncharacterized protein involved in exopolysaccharide biosynthesis